MQRKALRCLREHAPHFLDRLKDVQPEGQVHYCFWQRGGGYDRNINDPRTLLYMIEYIHQNPIRRGLVKRATEWPWSSARFYAAWPKGLVPMDSLPVLEA